MFDKLGVVPLRDGVRLGRVALPERAHGYLLTHLAIQAEDCVQQPVFKRARGLVRIEQFEFVRIVRAKPEHASFVARFVDFDHAPPGEVERRRKHIVNLHLLVHQGAYRAW